MLVKMTATIDGTTPLLVHADTLSNPLDPRTRELKAITSKRNKTEEDHLLISRLEWEGGLYRNRDGKPYIPEECIIAMLGNTAKRRKLGTAVKQASFCAEKEPELSYEGDCSYDDPRFRDMRMLRLEKKRVLRTRPKFWPWSLSFSLYFSGDVLDPVDVEKILNDAGTLNGFCDGRPRFGRFVVRECKFEEVVL